MRIPGHGVGCKRIHGPGEPLFQPGPPAGDRAAVTAVQRLAETTQRLGQAFGPERVFERQRDRDDALETAIRCAVPGRRRTGRRRGSANAPSAVTHSTASGSARMAELVRRNAAAPRRVPGSIPNTPIRRMKP